MNGALGRAPRSIGSNPACRRGVPVQSLLSQYKVIASPTNPVGAATNQTERPPTCRTSLTTPGFKTPSIVSGTSSTEPTNVPAASNTTAPAPDGPCGPAGPTIPAGPPGPA